MRVCKGCTVIGLDVLDAHNITPTLRYISEFKREIAQPAHRDAEDLGPAQLLRHQPPAELAHARALSRAFGGQVWLTETGGIVKFGGAFPNCTARAYARGEGAQVHVHVAAVTPRIKRLYIYNWTGGNAATRFDAGLTTPTTAAPGLRRRLQAAARREMQRQDREQLTRD